MPVYFSDIFSHFLGACLCSSPHGLLQNCWQTFLSEYSFLNLALNFSDQVIWTQCRILPIYFSDIFSHFLGACLCSSPHSLLWNCWQTFLSEYPFLNLALNFSDQVIWTQCRFLPIYFSNIFFFFSWCWVVFKSSQSLAKLLTNISKWISFFLIKLWIFWLSHLNTMQILASLFLWHLLIYSWCWVGFEPSLSLVKLLTNISKWISFFIKLSIFLIKSFEHNAGSCQFISLTFINLLLMLGWVRVLPVSCEIADKHF